MWVFEKKCRKFVVDEKNIESFGGFDFLMWVVRVVSDFSNVIVLEFVLVDCVCKI